MLYLSCLKMFKNQQLGQIRKTSVFPETGLKSLGRVGTHIFFKYFFSGKLYNFMHFERHFAFQNA